MALTPRQREVMGRGTMLLVALLLLLGAYKLGQAASWMA